MQICILCKYQAVARTNMPLDSETYEALGLHMPPSKSIDYTQLKVKPPPEPEGERQYHPCPEAYPSQEIPKGDVIHIKDWSESKVYPDTSRDIYVYTSPNLDQTSEPPSLAFFSDGFLYFSPNGPVRAAKVMDSLVHSRHIPPTVGVFVNSGKERSFEYDSVTPTFLNFINEEIIPMVEDHLGYELNRDSSKRLIVGQSSGGLCAFNAAWHSPTSFGCVLSHCGSFTNIRGGHNYPYLVRSTERKPIKVILQSGKDDMNTTYGNWAIANKDMASALEFSGYDFKFVFGEGSHSVRHGGAIFADSLRWLWS